MQRSGERIKEDAKDKRDEEGVQEECERVEKKGDGVQKGWEGVKRE